VIPVWIMGILKWLRKVSYRKWLITYKIIIGYLKNALIELEQ